jgi:putative spermidine/putrescine transport system permease protein
MPSYIYQQAIALQNWPFAAAISMIFLAAVLAVLAVLAALSRLSKGAAHV